MDLGNKSLSTIYKSILTLNTTASASGSSGISTATENLIQDGSGGATSLYLGSDIVRVKPSTDEQNAFVVTDRSGINLFRVDTQNNQVKHGVGLAHYVGAGIMEWKINHLITSPVAGTHYPFMADVVLNGAMPTLGTGADPDSTWDFSADSYGHFMPLCWRKSPGSIYIDEVKVDFSATHTNTGTDVHFHLLKLAVSSSAGTEGDITSATVIASSSADIEDITSNTHYVDTLSIASSSVNAGNYIVPTIEYVSLGTTTKAVGKMTVKFHVY